MDLNVLRLPLGGYQTNCYIVYDEENHGFIVDPGAQFSLIKKALDQYEIIPEMVILTHSHGDHIGALKEVVEHYGIPTVIHERELEFLKSPHLNLSGAMGLSQYVPKDIRTVKEGDVIDFHGHELKILHTPGHTPGGMSILSGKLLFSGDTLFFGSIGRTDFPGGSYKDIIDSIRRLVALPDDTIILSGHGQESVVKFEREHNPFL